MPIAWRWNMPHNRPFMVISLSARALAQAVRRARRTCLALDLFGDRDTRAAAAGFRQVAGDLNGFADAALIAAVRELAAANDVQGLIYGSGFEARPDMLHRLGQFCRVYGNSPETVRCAKAPQQLFATLARLGIPFPEMRLEAPGTMNGWLVKREGGSGGMHVQPARGEGLQPGQYFQRRVEGRLVSGLFLANGQDARMVGFNEQWVHSGNRTFPFAYAGACSNPHLEPGQQAQMEEIVQAVTRAFGLLGLNGIDFIMAGQTPYVIDVNPRPTATLELHDQAGQESLFAAHVRACTGDLGRPVARPAGSRAHAVVYTRSRLLVTEDFRWPAWCSDIPQGAAMMGSNQPACMVHAAGDTADAAIRAAVFRHNWISDRLEQIPAAA